MHGVTKPVTLVATEEGTGRDPWGNERMGFSAHGKLDRREFGLTWNAPLETGGVVVGPKVRIELNVERRRSLNERGLTRWGGGSERL